MQTVDPGTGLPESGAHQQGKPDKRTRAAVAIKSGTQIAELARQEGHSESYIRFRAKSAFLSPKIQAAILAGTQPVKLTTDRLVKGTLPSDWREQQRLPGFSQ